MVLKDGIIRFDTEFRGDIFRSWSKQQRQGEADLWRKNFFDTIKGPLRKAKCDRTEPTAISWIVTTMKWPTLDDVMQQEIRGKLFPEVVARIKQLLGEDGLFPEIQEILDSKPAIAKAVKAKAKGKVLPEDTLQTPLAKGGRVVQMVAEFDPNDPELTQHKITSEDIAWVMANMPNPAAYRLKDGLPPCPPAVWTLLHFANANPTKFLDVYVAKALAKEAPDEPDDKIQNESDFNELETVLVEINEMIRPETEAPDVDGNDDNTEN